MKPYKILIIEDDPVIQGEMETLLRGNGYTAVSVKDFSKVTDTFKAEEPHLILLDIKLPNESGFSICSKIRSISNVPIIFVTSCNTDMDELNSIMLGGDAFITKPYNTAILLAKIAALLRRVYASEQSEILTWNDATLHLESSMIEYKGQKAELTKNELKILYYLFKSAGYAAFFCESSAAYSASSSFTFGNFFKFASSKAAFAALCSVICSRCSSKNFLLYPALR